MIAVGPEVLNRNFQTTGAAGATCREGGGVGDGEGGGWHRRTQDQESLSGELR